MHFSSSSSSMLFYISGFVFWSLKLIVCLEFGSVEKNENITEHLARRLREVKVEIIKEYIEAEDDIESAATLSYDVKWEKLASERFNFSELALAISMFDRMFILEGNRAMSVDVKTIPNDTSSTATSCKRSPFVRQGRSIKFVKSIVWKSRLYLLVCEKDDCNLYVGENHCHLEDDGQLMHHRGMSDAIFFTRGNQLYLIVTHDKTDEFPGSSTIYHWTGSYMDMIQPIGTVGDVLVTAFNYGKSTIIAFGQRASDVVGLEIYSFVNDIIRRIQYLPTNAPISIIHYNNEGQDFLLIINEREASSVYWWNAADTEFLHWVDLSEIVAPKRVNVVHHDGDTLFFVAHENSVGLYKVTRSKYWRLSIMNLKDNCEKLIDMGVRIDRETKVITLLLVTFDPTTNRYCIEPWKLVMKKYFKNNAAGTQDAIDTIEQCLSRLHERLSDRMIVMENLKRQIWPELLATGDDTAKANRLFVDELILESSTSENSIKIDFLEIDTSDDNTNILLTMEIKTNVSTMKNMVSSFLAESQKMLRIHGENRLTGDIIIDGDAKFHQLRTNFIRTGSLNGRQVNFEDYSPTSISATRNQIFANASLVGNNITVRYLQIDKLCGIPHEYWLRNENEESSDIFLIHNLTDVTIKNDTIHVQSPKDTFTVTLRDLELRSIDGTNINDLFDDLFIPGEKQSIKGNIVQRAAETSINVVNLVAKELNGISIGELLTRVTEQNITGSVRVDGRMLVKNLIVTSINGIAITDFAMVSKKNQFTGQISIANLRILNELTINDTTKFPMAHRPVQVYETVTVYGDVKARNVVLESRARLSSSLPSLTNTRHDYWTKSTKQTLKNPICFVKGLTIDELTIDYLNGYDLNDIMLTSVNEIFPKFHSIELKNFTARQLIPLIRENENFTASNEPTPRRLYVDSSDSLIINEKIRIEQLSVASLHIDSFNGIPVDFIMRKNFDNSTITPYDYATIDSSQKFESVTVNNRLTMENLYLKFVNDNDGSNAERIVDDTVRKSFDNSFLRSDADYTIERLESEKLTLGHLRIVDIAKNTFDDTDSPEDNRYSMKFSKKFSPYTRKDCSHLTIDGDALIEENLQAATINEKNSLNYLEAMSIEDFSIDFTDKMIINDLTVHGNLTLNFLHGARTETLLGNILTRSRDQSLDSSEILFLEIFADELNVERINDRAIENLIFVDSREINFRDNVIFDNLSIFSMDPSSTTYVRTKYLNGYSTLTDELYEKLGNISSRMIGNLSVRGNIFWQKTRNESSKKCSRFETITKHGLMRNNESPFVINTNGNEGTIIESTRGVFVASMTSSIEHSRKRRSINHAYVRKIIEDSVLDDPDTSRGTNEMRVDGVKTFKMNFGCSRLVASGEIVISELDRWSIDDLKSSIVRVNFSRNDNKFGEKNTTMIFRGGIGAKKIFIKNNNDKSNGSRLLVHGLPIDGIFTRLGNDSEKILPEFTQFRNLIVLNDASVETLDSVNFNDFANDRVSLEAASELPIVIQGNVRFNGHVRVTESALVRSINDIVPFDLVINDSSEDQIIFGSKTLISGDLVIDGETFVPVVAGIDLRGAYENSVLRDEQVEIFGDIIFQDDIEKSSGYIEMMPSEEYDSRIISSPMTRNDTIAKGFVNEICLKSFIDDRDSLDNRFLADIAKNEDNLKARIGRISNVSLPEIFHYFEPERYPMIGEIANVERVRVARTRKTTILGLYTSESGNFCGFSYDCYCRRQYVAEISANRDDLRTWKIHDSRIFYQFNEPNDAFSINVTTTSVSRNEHCSLNRNERSFDEFTTISWMKNEKWSRNRQRSSSDGFIGANLTKDSQRIYGYLSDAFVFMQNDLAYIVLAMHYDPIRSTHQTNSFIYVLDLVKNVLKLAQSIPTSHAVGVQVFEIPRKGPHIFFSSFANGNTTESVLYRLDARTAQFEELRCFTSAGNRHAKSVSRANEEFIFLDDFGTNSIGVYRYDEKFDNFYPHQSIYHDSMAPVTSIETLYIGEFRHGQVYVIVVTERDQFFIYDYTFTNNFRLMTRKKINGILSMVPFDVADRRYVFLGTDTNSTVLRIVQQGSSRGTI